MYLQSYFSKAVLAVLFKFVKLLVRRLGGGLAQLVASLIASTPSPVSTWMGDHPSM